MKMFVSRLLMLAEKDVRIELRSKETFFSTLLFLALTLFIFNFSFNLDPETVHKIAPGIIWVVITLSGTLALNHLASRDQEDEVATGLLLTGCTGTSFFFSKLFTTLLFMIGIEVVTIPMFIVFFNFSMGSQLHLLVMVLALGTIGYAAVGTLFASLLSHARLKNMLLPVALYPVVIPLLIAAVRATALILAEENANAEIALLLGFDLIFVSASSMLFDFVVEEPS